MQETIRTARLWLKAFIPHDAPEARPAPGTQHAGKTMLGTPPNLYFLTDQRTFSSDPEAEARMHTEIALDLLSGVVIHERYRCWDTVQIDVNTGEELCREQAGTDDMRYRDMRRQDERVFTLDLRASARNACVRVASIPLAPSCDFHGTISLTLSENRRAVEVTYDGMVETYPAFEMYASINDAAPVAVFTAPIVPGATLLSLTGAPTRPIRRSVVIEL